MSNTYRALVWVGIGNKLQSAIVGHHLSNPDGITPSCISCEFFTEESETCAASDDQRPPARIIALGCRFYKDKDDIPF